jgi:hypothetical protein
MKLYVSRTVPLSETRRVLFQNKFVKLVHLFGFITEKCFACLLTIKTLIFVIKITARIAQLAQLTKPRAG